VLPPDPKDATAADLELDEVWSFVGNKRNPVYVWIALCRATRQVIAMVTGHRSAATCWRLWLAIPEPYRRGFCYTDFWQSYQAGIPDEQHVASGKETGSTAHIERWNNTFASASDASSARPCPSPNARSCTGSVYSCSSTATILKLHSSFGEPLVYTWWCQFQGGAEDVEPLAAVTALGRLSPTTTG